jgi:hypothetical protein
MVSDSSHQLLFVAPQGESKPWVFPLINVGLPSVPNLRVIIEILTGHREQYAQVYELHDYYLKILWLWPSLAVIDAWKEGFTVPVESSGIQMELLDNGMDSTGFHWIPLDSSPKNNSSGFQADVCGTVKHSLEDRLPRRCS